MGDRVVIDTSVLVSAFKSADGAARQIVRLCLIGELSPLMGDKLFLEAEAVMERQGLFLKGPSTPEDRRNVFHAYLSVCRWVNISFLWRPNLPDEGDNHVLELALAGGAGMIITHNIIDFTGELQFPEVKILTPGQYLRQKR